MRRRRSRAIREFQDLMKKLYLQRDKRRGVHGTTLWMISEIGELAGAILKRDRKLIKDEVADVFAWLCSTCNLFEIDLEKASFEKYPDCCPRCRHTPCRCQEE